MLYAFIIFLVGLIIITIGAELLLKGASTIAALLGIKPIVIGLTVVSIGTSLPELAVGITAVHEGTSDIAIGNIAGTNLVNLLFILGLSAAIRPLPLHIKAIKFEMMVMIFAAFLLLLLSLDGVLSYYDGLVMLLCGIAYVILTINMSKAEPQEIKNEYEEEYALSNNTAKKNTSKWIINSVLLMLGITGTIIGADYLVAGASAIARTIGMSDAVIGLTIVAIGTSAPELVTTIIATIKNDRDVAIGNLLGSSITNVLIILGATNVLTGKDMLVQNDILWFDLPIAALVAVVCYPIFRSGHRVSRVEGALFVLLYITYMIYILNYRS